MPDKGPAGVKGYSVDVFKAAVGLLPYPVSFDFILFGDGLKNPSYNDLIQKVSDNVRNIPYHSILDVIAV